MVNAAKNTQGRLDGNHQQALIDLGLKVKILDLGCDGLEREAAHETDTIPEMIAQLTKIKEMNVYLVLVRIIESCISRLKRKLAQ